MNLKLKSLREVRGEYGKRKEDLIQRSEVNHRHNQTGQLTDERFSLMMGPQPCLSLMPSHADRHFRASSNGSI